MWDRGMLDGEGAPTNIGVWGTWGWVHSVGRGLEGRRMWGGGGMWGGGDTPMREGQGDMGGQGVEGTWGGGAEGRGWKGGGTEGNWG